MAQRPLQIECEQHCRFNILQIKQTTASMRDIQYLLHSLERPSGLFPIFQSSGSCLPHAEAPTSSALGALQAGLNSREPIRQKAGKVPSCLVFLDRSPWLNACSFPPRTSCVAVDQDETRMFALIGVINFQLQVERA